MVTVYGNEKEQAKAKAWRGLFAFVLAALLIGGFAAHADGLFLPDVLTGKKTKKPVAAAVNLEAVNHAVSSAAVVSQPVVSQPIVTQSVKPAITSGLTVAAPAVDAAVAGPEFALPTQIPVPQWRPEPDPRTQADLPDEDGAGIDQPKCNGNCGTNNGLAGQVANGKKVAAAAVANDDAEDAEEEAPLPAVNAKRSDLSKRLSQAAWASAARCRDFAQFKKRRMGLSQKKRYNSCNFFKKSNVFKSKGMCAAGVREAFADAGIRIAAADARNLRPNLVRAGFKPVKFEPAKVKSGTVLVCNGGKSGYGHTEIVVDQSGERWFCSDFCSRNTTCSSKKGYSKMTAYSLGI